MLCLHGIEAHGVRFLGLAQRLERVQVVAPDLRGHGRSPMEGPWTIDQHVRDLLPLLESLGPRTVVLGHSYGGLIAWELARRAADRISGLVLVDPAIAVGAELARISMEQFSVIDRHWADESVALRELSVGRPASALWSVALDVAVSLKRDADGSLRPMLAPRAPRARWAQMQEQLRPSEWHGPTLLLEAGRENGLYVSPQVVTAMRAGLADSLDHVVIDAGHAIPSDHPELLAQHVGAFVAALSPTRRRLDATRS